MLASLDDSYSKFMSKEEFMAQNSAINSKLYGIGINIASLSGKIYIINVLENAPAYIAGIRSGDIILKVNGEDVNGQTIYHVARLIRGDVNQSLELELLRGSEKFSKTVKREEIKTVAAKVPTKMTLPTVLLILPAILCVIMGPVIIQVKDQLSGMSLF